MGPRSVDAVDDCFACFVECVAKFVEALVCAAAVIIPGGLLQVRSGVDLPKYTSMHSLDVVNAERHQLLRISLLVAKDAVISVFGSAALVS